MKNILRLLPIVTLAACSTVQTTAYTNATGKQALNISCSEFSTTLEQCKEKAREFCASDIDVVSHFAEVYPYADDGMYWPTKHYLDVECQNS